MNKFSKTSKQQHVCVCPGESVEFLGIISVSQDPPLTRELSTRQCEQLIIGMTPGVIAIFTPLGESHFVWPSPVPLQTL